MNPKVIKGVVFVSALAAGAALGTAIGSAGGPHDDWGCGEDRIGTETYTTEGEGGFASQELALAGHIVLLAADGARDVSEYVLALGSRTGPTRYDPGTGELFVGGKLEAQLTLTQHADETWSVAKMTLCMAPPPPGITSPHPTPGINEPAT